MLRSLFICVNPINFLKEAVHISTKVGSAVKICVVLCVSFSLVIPGVLGVASVFHNTRASEQIMVSKIAKEIEIPPGSDYFIRFDAQNLTLKGEDIEPLTNGLSETVIAAIAKSPRWIQQRLTSQFHESERPGKLCICPSQLQQTVC